MLHRDDLIRLRHMLDACQEARDYAMGKTRPDLDSDRLLMHSVVRCLEVVGEAAGQVSPAGRSELPAVPWTQIVGMRNHLSHAYFAVSLDRVWETLQSDLPPMISVLESALTESEAKLTP